MNDHDFAAEVRKLLGVESNDAALIVVAKEHDAITSAKLVERRIKPEDFPEEL